MKKRIYTDTSVIGGCLDAEFDKGSLELLKMFRSGSAIIVVSNLTLAELEDAPVAVQNILKEIPEKHIVNLERIHGYNSVNLKLGYPILEIRNPMEVLEYEN